MALGGIPRCGQHVLFGDPGAMNPFLVLKNFPNPNPKNRDSENTSIFPPLGDQQKQGIQEKTHFSQSYSAFFGDNPFSAKKIPSQMLCRKKTRSKNPRKTHTHTSLILRFASSMLGKRPKHIPPALVQSVKKSPKKKTHPSCCYT